MKVIVADFETMWADDYTLKTMTPVEYLLSPRFEAIGCAIKEGLDGKPYWVPGPDLPHFFNECARDVLLVSHNMLFDGALAAWRYGYRPKLYSCTLALARAILAPVLKGFSLDRVAVHLRLGGKLAGVLPSAKNRSYWSISSDAGYYPSYIAYAENDAELCAGIFRKLAPLLPPEELLVIDMTMRMALQPSFELHVPILEQHLNDVIQHKAQLLQAAGFGDRQQLMSNDKLAAVLRGLGIEPPLKPSPTNPERTIYAFAKTDEGFRELLEHQDPVVQAVAAARLGVKSTIEETRTRRFISIAKLDWPPTGASNRWMPIALRYGAAHTHRFGGDWDLNQQNLGRGGKLRRSMQAPPGHSVVRVDASQIECRLTAWLAGEKKLLTAFEQGEDVYSTFGTALYGKPVSRDTPVERHLAKAAVLGCGFHMGWKKFMRTTNNARTPDSNGGFIHIDENAATLIVNTYRNAFFAIPQFWQFLQTVVIPCIAGYGADRMTVGPIVVMPEKAILPALTGELGKGLTLSYRDLRMDPMTGEWTFAWGSDRRKKLYSGKLLENFVQALDRVIVIGAALRLQKLLHPYILQHQAHDENIYIVPNAYADAVGQLALQEMQRRPAWGPDLPLAAEMRIGASYAG